MDRSLSQSSVSPDAILSFGRTNDPEVPNYSTIGHALRGLARGVYDNIGLRLDVLMISSSRPDSAPCIQMPIAAHRH
jgi:hypothetical protein